MRKFTPIVIVVVGGLASTLITAPAHADLGDQLFKLLPNDPAGDDHFGCCVAISGGTAIVGATENDDFGPNSGSAYLFDISTGLQYAKLLPFGDGAMNDRFGHSVAINGAIAIVGTPWDDDNGSDSGSAFIFDISNPVIPILISKVLPDDGQAGDVFGYSVSINGTTVIVGAYNDEDNGADSGSAYLFDISDPANPVQMFKLLANDGASGDFLGSSVAIDGSIALVGAWGNDDFGFDSGSAYLFDITTGDQIAKFFLNDSSGGDEFGFSVAIGDLPGKQIAIIGAPFDDDVNEGDAGSVYFFDISDPENPTQISKLLPSDGSTGDNFGYSVAYSANTVIIGARWDDDNGSSSGSAYLFDISDPANPAQISKLLADDGAASDFFGESVAISGATAIVGAWGDDDNGSASGSAYLFSATHIEFDPPEEFPALGEATVEVVGSFDATGNDTQDVAVIIPGSIPSGTGSVQVFLNQGNDEKSGDWIGLQEGALIPVGTIPSDITTGLFDDDDFIDLAVSNAGDNNISILLGDGNGSFIPEAEQVVGQFPSAVTSGDFDMDGNIDLAVTNAMDDKVQLLLGDGMGGFAPGELFDTNGVFAIDIDPEDLDDDKDLDITGINRGFVKGDPLNGTVFVMLNDGKGGFASAVNYTVGIDPKQLAIADIDGDTLADIVVVNGADATISVLLNEGNGTFGEAIEVGVGTDPRSIDAVDLNGDGDPDLVIAADNAEKEPVVQVLANITSDIGKVEFQLPLEFSVNADPNFVANADFNVDALPDIVTANQDNKTGGSVSVLLNDPPPLPTCPWDLDGSGSVGTGDLLELFTQWGTDGTADFDESGAVGTGDLLILFANWGPCS